MSVLSASGLTAAERKQMESMAAAIAQLEADQDYIAMMADIELDEESEDEA